MLTYLHIDCATFSEWGLTPSEAVVYAYIEGYAKSGHILTKRQTEIASDLNLSFKALRAVLDSLAERGFIDKVRRQDGMEYRPSERWREVSQLPKRESPNYPKGKVPITQKGNSQLPKRAIGNYQKGQLAHYILNINKGENNMCAPTRTREEELYAVISEGLADYYREELQSVYLPDWSSHTANCSDIARKVAEAMQADNFAPEPETMSTYWRDFLRMAYARGDDFIRSHFDAKTLNSQFNYIYQKIKLNANEPRKNDKRKDYSDDFIAEQLRKLAGK